MTEKDLQRCRDLKLEIRQAKKILDDFSASCDLRLATQKRYLFLLDQHHAECIRIESALDCLTPTERSVISEYYICAEKTWVQIAEDMHYTTRNIFKLRESALKKLEGAEI